MKAPIKFTFEGKEVKVVDDYTYLGVIFNFNGCFKKAIENQKTVALRAMQALLTKIRLLVLDVDTSIELFHRCVMPILLYGSEVWAFDTNNIATLDVLYKGFLKQILHIHISTPTCMVFGETGQPRLQRLIAQRQVGFWAKLKFDAVPRLSKLILPALVGLHGNRTSRTIISKDKTRKALKFDFKWITTLRHTLDHLGMGYIFDTFCLSEPREVLAEVKRRFADSSTQVWRSEVDEHQLCVNYRMFKREWGMSPYLTVLPEPQRTWLTKFRTRCHNLPICQNKFTKPDAPTQLKLCNLCNMNEIGDEFHYIFKCNAFSAKRKKLISPYFCERPNIIKYQELFESPDPEILYKLANFTHVVMNSFPYDKPQTPERLQESYTTRAGRVTKRPVRLADSLVAY